MSVMQNHTSVQKQKEKDGTYDCIIKRDLNSPNVIFFDGEVSDDLQYFPTKIIQQNNGGNKALANLKAQKWKEAKCRQRKSRIQTS